MKKQNNILIIHGWDAAPEDHWFLTAKEKWEKENLKVFVPKMSGGYFPKLVNWLKIIESFNPDENWILMGHSLGGAAILKYLEIAKKPIKKAILIATPFEAQKMGAVENFFGQGFDWGKIRENCQSFEVISEEDDMIVPLEHGKKISKELNVSLHVLPGCVHFHTIDLDFLEGLIKDKK